MRYPTFKSDIVIGLACFDYAVLFKLPKTVAVVCYQHVFEFQLAGLGCWRVAERLH